MDIVESGDICRIVFENSNEGILIIQDNCIIFSNDLCSDIVGYSKEELFEIPFLNLVHSDDRGMVSQNYMRRLQGEVFPPYMFRLLEKSGAARWVLFNGKLTSRAGKDAVIAFFTDITDAKINENRLKQYELEFKMLADNMSDLVCLLDKEGNFIYTNTQVEKKLLMSHSELHGVNAFSLLRDEDVTEAKRIFASLRTGKSHVGTFHLNLRNGDQLWLKSIVQRFVNNDGETVVEVISTDVTECTVYETKLRNSESLYKAMFHENGSMMLLVDPSDGAIVDINSAAMSFLGVQSFDSTGLFIQEFLPSTSFQSIKLRRILLEKSKGKFHIQCQIANGELKDLEVHSGVVELNDKELVYAILNDIGKRKRAEQEIISTNKRLNCILSISEYDAPSLEGLLEFVLDKVLEFVTSDVACFYALNIEEQTFSVGGCRSSLIDSCDRKVGDRFAFEDNKSLIELVRNGKSVVLQGEDLSASIQLVLGHKMREYLLLPLKERDEVVAFICVARRGGKTYVQKELRQLRLLMNSVWQVIEKHRSREELEKAKKKAEESDRLKSAFLANMSHEIRTPLNAIVGFSNLLSSDKMDKDERLKFGEIVERNGEQLLTLIDDIIDIAKIEGQQLTLKPDLVKVNEVIDHVAVNYQELVKRASKTQIKLIAHYSEKEVLCYIDNYRFNQIFFNLIGNAIKFTSQGEINFGLHHIKNDEFIFFVKDTGIGIEKSKQNAIFGEFIQEDEDIASRFGGTGLGLTITKRLVEMMNGRIWVESQKGEGAAFYFTIPAAGVQMQLALE